MNALDDTRRWLERAGIGPGMSVVGTGTTTGTSRASTCAK